ncbi:MULTISPECIES: hypothetical protein [Protofrankia]|nr:MULTISPECIES: hypothetical protein [Protofrankia]
MSSTIGQPTGTAPTPAQVTVQDVARVQRRVRAFTATRVTDTAPTAYHR